MSLKKTRPITPGQRFKLTDSFEDLTLNSSNNPEKSLLAPKHSKGGRNNTGKMTMRYLGGGHKQRWRLIDFKRDKFNVPATVMTIEYDPNRTARIALLNYADGEKRYIIAPNGLKVGQKLLSGKNIAPDTGNTLYLGEMPLGTTVHNIELRPGQGAKLARSAGSYAQLSARDGRYVILRMPSGETRMVLGSCLATVGSVSNPDHNLEIHGKAGRRRWLGRRPRNRGVSMNPVDHPMGGGEGKASGGHPRSRKGIPAKGYKTRHKKKGTNRFIIERRKK
ncbi:MAG: 50S ribosomal protein L2 [Bacteroidia bacterium]|nr:50S ribosomal protein L2 [Bacteroidia bacterium]